MIGAASRTTAPASKPSPARSRLAATSSDGRAVGAAGRTSDEAPGHAAQVVGEPAQRVRRRRPGRTARPPSSSPASWAPCSAAAASSRAALARGAFAAFSASRSRASSVSTRCGTFSSRSPSSWAVARSASSRVAHQLGGGLAGHRLDASQSGADARLAGDDERADLPGRGHVRPAAQLLAVAVDLDDPDRLGQVLLAEEHVGAERLRPLDRHELGLDGRVAPDLRVHQPLDLAQRLARRRRLAPGSRSAARPGPTHEPACLACSPSTSRSARCSRCVPVWLRAAPQRRASSTSARTASPTRELARQRRRGGRSRRRCAGCRRRAAARSTPISSPRSPICPPPSA